MPELILRDLVIKKLKESDYNYRFLLRSKSHSYFVKDYIASLNDDVNILENNVFEVNIDIKNYNEIIFTETYHGSMRISRQFDAISALASSPNAPKAWLLVTVYYHSFFCANLIARLLGRYSCYFAKEQISSIISSADNPDRYHLDHGNYVGHYISINNNSVKLKFRNEGDRPHHTAWKNLCDKFTLNQEIVDPDRLNRIKLFKDIINTGSNRWPVPSEVRNKWNYSDVLLFSKTGDNIAKEFCSMLEQRKDISWASNRRIQPDHKNIVASVAYVSSTLNRSIDVIKNKILQ